MITKRATKSKTQIIPISQIRPMLENEKLYRPVSSSDPDVIALSDSIRANGILEPLVITKDGFLLSGHRRLMAAQLAGLREVPVRCEAISYWNQRDECVKRLALHNQQRIKSNAELLSEAVMLADPEASYTALCMWRAENRDKSQFCGEDLIENPNLQARSKISKAKLPFLEAVCDVINDLREYWPLSDRQVHYALLNDPPLRNANKKKSLYRNDTASYKDLCNLLTRARLMGYIPWAAIDDPTRPVSHAVGWQNTQDFLRDEFNQLFGGYWRNLQQTQPAHIEIIAEKLTVQSIIRTVTDRYCLPLTIARGYPSIEARRKIVERFTKSGKDRLVLIFATDHDPEGCDIPQGVVGSLVRDFDVDEDEIAAIKAAITPEQIAQHKLPPTMEAKKTSARYKKFARQHGTNAYELEALPPEVLQKAIDDAILSVLDTDSLKTEIKAEKQDAAFLAATRRRVLTALGPMIEGSA